MPQLQAKLEAALQRRNELPGSEALRLFDGPGDGIPGLLIDRLGAAVIVRVHDGSPAGALDISKVAPLLAGLSGVRFGVLWRHSGDAAETTRQGCTALFGTIEPEITFFEDGLQFLARPEATPSAGFFTDMRDVRSDLRRSAAAKRVLNTFCFTGSLGLAALAGGASEVVQVDISKSVLNWARKTRELNASSVAGDMRFIPEDTGTFLAREVRRLEKGGRLYDRIVIDPPAFGSSSGKRFVQEEELPRLVESAIRLLDAGGELFLTSNRTVVTPAGLESLVRGVAAGLKREIHAISALYPPRVDFPSRGAESNAMRGVKVSF